MPTEDTDNIRSPSHYTRGSIEVKQFLLDQDLNWCQSLALKYICRAGHKEGESESSDLQKAIEYLKMRIAKLDDLQEPSPAKEAKMTEAPTEATNDIVDLLQDLNWCQSLALKYICRAGYKEGKSESSDLQKAIEYLKMRIAKLDDLREPSPAGKGRPHLQTWKRLRDKL